MSRPEQEGAAATAEAVRNFWDAHTQKLDPDAELSRFATVTEDAALIRQRDRLEKAHLARVLSWGSKTRVLDLGGGAGRFALWLAPDVASVTLVDNSKALLKVAKARAAREGIGNLETVLRSAPDFQPATSYDLILVMGVAAHLADREVELVAELAARALATGGTVALKEPVTTDGSTRDDDRYDEQGKLVYHARFRPRHYYREVLGRHLTPIYQRSTCAHFFPWFLKGAPQAAEAAGTRLGGAMLRLLGRALVSVDPWLLDIEEQWRVRPLLGRLLAPVDVLQDLYLFRAKGGSAPESAQLSVVVIAYNEQECLEPVVREIAQFLSLRGLDFELVLVDDGSTDTTRQRMEALAAEDARIRVVPLWPNRGIGSALRAGFDAARGAYITWIPADGQIPPETIFGLYQRRHEGDMITTVYRTRGDPWYRSAISGTLNSLIRASTGQAAKSGGNYLFRREMWDELAPRQEQSMMISTAFRQRIREAGHSIVEVETDCRARYAGRSKVLNPRTVLRTLGGLAALMLRKRSG